jgi:hypothetical protein
VQIKYTFELNITIADAGSSAGDVIELYGIQVRDDVDQTAWNMCDCDDEAKSEKFSDLVLENWSVTHNQGDDFYIKALFTVNAQSEEFINQVLEEYMDGFADWIAVTLNGYYSRTGMRVPFNPYPLNWELETK